MKILLIKPPLNPNLLTVSLYEPLELEYLAASVKDSDVRILDMRIDRNLKRELINFKPDLVGITAYTCDYNTVVTILKQVREFDSTIKTVAGGSHATFSPDDFVLPYVDAVFIGYADSTFPQYVKAVDNPDRLKDIPNIGIIDKESVFFTKKVTSVPDLNSLPLPDRNLTRKYQKHYHDPLRNKIMLIMTSRGCPFRCNFCACWKLMDGKYTVREPESIIEELKSLPEETDIVYFSDDNTFNDIARMWRLSELIKKNNIRKRFQMYARADTIVSNRDLFEDMKAAGLQFISIGLESFRDEDLEYYNKRISVEINTRAIRILKELDIHIIALFIIRPDYTEENFNQLFEYIYRNNLFRPAFPVLTPLPGTELYEETSDLFELTNFDFFDFAHSVLPTRLEPKEFYRQLTNIYFRSFSLKRLVNHRLNRLLSLNRDKFFTDNTDGITIGKLILMAACSLSMAKRMRYTFRDLNADHNNLQSIRGVNQELI